jgi:palmitoyltransferase ZDHHC9/14/18
MGLYYAVCGWRVPIALLVITACCHLFGFIFLLALGLKDPGFIAKIYGEYERREMKEIPMSEEYTSGAVRDYQRIYSMIVKTHFLRIKFCQNCLIFRPPRTSHCYECNMCVERFDHHCPWIGTCVGRGNYGLFICFVGTLWVLSILAVVQSILVMVWEGPSQAAAFYPNLLLSVLGFLAFLFLCSLFFFHIFLTLKNQTTN